MDSPNFLGMGNFVWWFGVVENRKDPLELGRCQVRCFGWHTEDITQIPSQDLPWAHPVVPYGASAVQPPPEGAMVFGFFADGKEALYPIILGTVPGIPQELRDTNTGFSDPNEASVKEVGFFPRKIREAYTPVNNSGVKFQNEKPKRYPGVIKTNEPTISRLARPQRNESKISGHLYGIVGASIANTTIDIQRKNRVANIISASPEKYKWHEPFPSFAAKYPFNHVTETESGHAFEMDDTPAYERVQLSHRVGSTIEFMTEGDVKLKSMKNKYDITMGNKYEYINGKRDETIQSDMYLRVNGKLVIQCNGLQISSAGDIDMKGQNVNITGVKKLNLSAPGVAVNGITTSITGSLSLDAFGGSQCKIGSAGYLYTNAPVVGLNALTSYHNAVMINTQGIHNLFSPLPQPPTQEFFEQEPAKAKRAKAPTPALQPTAPNSSRHPNTNRFGRQEQLKTELDPKAAKAMLAAIEAAKKATVAAGAPASVPTPSVNVSATIDPKTGAVTAVVAAKDPADPEQKVTTQTTTITPPAESSAQKAAGTSATPLTVPDNSSTTTVVNGG